jgi:hypothetical protein
MARCSRSHQMILTSWWQSLQLQSFLSPVSFLLRWWVTKRVAKPREQCKCVCFFLPMNVTTSHLLLVHRSNEGIPSATTHKLLFSRAAELSNVVVLDDVKPHTLPLGMSFFRVNNSVVDGKNIRVNKFILAVQCFSPDALDIMPAHLSAD